MKYLHLSILASLVLSGSCIAQTGSIFIETNYNTFTHSSLKSFQEEFINDIPEVPIQVNDNFPAHFGFTVGYTINAISSSLFFNYNTTGGKISYSDFSGTIRTTQLLKGYTVGGSYLLKIIKDSEKLHLGLKAFSTFSSLEVSNYGQLLDTVNEATIDFRSIDIGIGANLIYEHPISFFKLRAVIGYDLVLGGKLFFKENKDFHLENNTGDTVKTGWSGLRTGIGISVPL